MIHILLALGWSGSVQQSIPSYYIPLKNYYNVQYTGTVLLGESKVDLIFDTGSFDSWVTGEHSRGNCPGNSDGYKDRIYSDDEARIELSYGDQTKVAGNLVTDVLTLEGLDSEKCSASPITFLKATSCDLKVSMDADGILGMAWRNTKVSSTSVTYPSVLLSLQTTCGSEFAFFKFFLSFIGSSDPSYLSFGNENDLERKGDLIQWAKTPQNQNQQWLVSVLDVRWSNESPLDFNVDSLPDVEPFLVDSGTSLILVERVIFQKMFRRLLEKGICVSLTMCRCPTSIDEESKFLPEIHFYVESANSTKDDPIVLSLKSRHYLIPLNSSTNNCVFAINPIPKGADKSWNGILGMPFLRAYPTTFHVKTASVGFEKNLVLPPFHRHHTTDPILSQFAFFLGSGLGFLVVSLFVLRRFRQNRELNEHEHGFLSRSDIELQEAP